jgi:hypothetical protein
MDVLIVIGDQDSYHETESELVESPIWLADILRDEGLIGLFVLQARRAEILAEQGRRDVIAALRRHEIGLHGRDVHPVLPELVEGLSWHDGVEAVLAVEGAELRRLGQIFDVAPVCSSQHRNHGTPQAFGAARRLGLPYLFSSPAAPPAYSVSWYAGTLSVPLVSTGAWNVPFVNFAPSFLGFFPSVFDDALGDDQAFASLLGKLREHVQAGLAAGLPLLVVFVCHPERLGYAGPVEQWLYANGANHGRAAVPPGVEVRHSRARVERALTNFRTLIRYLRDAPGLEPITVSDLVRRYGQQAPEATRSDLTMLANRALEGTEIPIGSALSAAESLLAFADSLVHWVDHGLLPATAKRRDVLGPLVAPPLAPEAPSLTLSQLAALGRELLAVAGANGYLPAALPVEGRLIGLGTLYGALARAYVALANGREPPAPEFSLAAWPRYPAPAMALGELQRLCLEDPLIRPGLSTDAAALQARLQTWTLKPAQRQ